jgi:hypothetical protein
MNKYGGLPRSFWWRVKSLNYLNKYVLVLNFEIEYSKMQEALVRCISDKDKLPYEETNFEKLKEEYPSEIEDIQDVETYYNILKRHAK